MDVKEAYIWGDPIKQEVVTPEFFLFIMPLLLGIV